MDNLNKKTEKVITDLEKEKQNPDSPFVALQLDEVIGFLKYLLNNNGINENNPAEISDTIKKINYWAADSWPYENKITIEITEIMEAYEKIIKKHYAGIT
ncbi:hypothetical protein [Breznakiella homolactica]|uniref:Uncharacterized protein n=1 Tax=Breznakiella homolactica TaxID=2798577 RepID=A0A7T8BBL7_9SPIR|nr:hypothetical protein [Breznakiella homolactica]QQO10536.1 hypothetical protein JFL75_06375 [Breznakiella homolactica]